MPLRHIKWMDFVENYENIFQELKNNHDVVYVVKGDGKPFVLGSMVYNPYREHAGYSLDENDPPLLKLDPNDFKANESGRRNISICVDGIYTNTYDGYRRALEEQEFQRKMDAKYPRW